MLFARLYNQFRTFHPFAFGRLESIMLARYSMRDPDSTWRAIRFICNSRMRGEDTKVTWKWRLK